MTNFEKIATSPETLGTFLASLSIVSGRWDEAFRRTFCDRCPAENCDGQDCPHKAERGNPLRWLTQEAGRRVCCETVQERPLYVGGRTKRAKNCILTI